MRERVNAGVSAVQGWLSLHSHTGAWLGPVQRCSDHNGVASGPSRGRHGPLHALLALRHKPGHVLLLAGELSCSRDGRTSATKHSSHTLLRSLLPHIAAARPKSLRLCLGRVTRKEEIACLGIWLSFESI